MSFSVILTYRFEKELKRLSKKYPSIKSDFTQLIKEITDNPKLGTFLGNNCYKIRLAIASKGKGKSGGARVITYLYFKSGGIVSSEEGELKNKEPEIVYLLTIYDKSEKTDLKPNELKEMIESLELD
jgi:mRNA-degrading endonuclease RelE of RelBE toxin-antitoxin system